MRIRDEHELTTAECQKEKKERCNKERKENRVLVRGNCALVLKFGDAKYILHKNIFTTQEIRQYRLVRTSVPLPRLEGINTNTTKQAKFTLIENKIKIHSNKN